MKTRTSYQALSSPARKSRRGVRFLFPILARRCKTIVYKALSFVFHCISHYVTIILLPTMNPLPSLSWANTPSTLRGAARTVDMLGKLDEYRTSPDADCRLIRNDWENIGNDIRVSIVNYGQAQEQTALADPATRTAA